MLRAKDGRAMSPALSDRLSTGIDGLDEILHGGFIPERSYMLRGPAGSGKTILGCTSSSGAFVRAKRGCSLI